MSDLSWILFASLLLLLAFLLILLLLWVMRSNKQNQLLLMKSQKLSNQMLLRLMKDQRQENQLLRNQILSQSVPELIGRNHATLPSEATASNSDVPEPVSLEDAVFNEELMAKQGYVLGDTGGFESSGWASPIIRHDGSDPVAFEPS